MKSRLSFIRFPGLSLAPKACLIFVLFDKNPLKGIKSAQLLMFSKFSWMVYFSRLLCD